jgi:hypothetical protein
LGSIVGCKFSGSNPSLPKHNIMLLLTQQQRQLLACKASVKEAFINGMHFEANFA